MGANVALGDLRSRSHLYLSYRLPVLVIYFMVRGRSELSRDLPLSERRGVTARFDGVRDSVRIRRWGDTPPRPTILSDWCYRSRTTDIVAKPLSRAASCLYTIGPLQIRSALQDPWVHAPRLRSRSSPRGTRRRRIRHRSRPARRPSRLRLSYFSVITANLIFYNNVDGIDNPTLAVCPEVPIRGLASVLLASIQFVHSTGVIRFGPCPNYRTEAPRS